MEKPEVFLDFKKNIPSSTLIVCTDKDEEQHTPEVDAACKALVDIVFNHDSLSRKIAYATDWAMIARPLSGLPELNGHKDVNGFPWFVGHYDWSAIEEAVGDKEDAAVYLVPSLGQSIQTSRRHELVYNAFICTKGQPPFTHLIQRLPTVEEEKDVDEELFHRSDPIVIKSIDEFDMEWAELEEFKFGKAPVFIFRPNRRFRTGLADMPQNDFELWFDCMMGNFLPMIPFPKVNGSELKDIPLVMIDTVVATPPSYNELIERVQKVNALIPEGEKNIKNIIKFWQHDSVMIHKAFVEFANAGEIPNKSPSFNNLFFEQLKITREFIIDDIFKGYLGIERPDEEEKTYFRGMQSECYWELDELDLEGMKTIKGKELKEAVVELRKSIDLWFDRQSIQKLYDEYKQVITDSINAQLKSPGLAEYIRVNNEDASSETRNKWLEEFHEGKNILILWPTVYTCNPEPPNERLELLEAIDKDVIAHSHSNITEVRGTPIPHK